MSNDVLNDVNADIKYLISHKRTKRSAYVSQLHDNGNWMNSGE